MGVRRAGAKSLGNKVNVDVGKFHCAGRAATASGDSNSHKAASEKDSFKADRQILCSYFFTAFALILFIFIKQISCWMMRTVIVDGSHGDSTY